MPPRVSVNICCFNSERYLQAALESVCAQTFNDWELVIINDGSTDATDRIVRRFLAGGTPIVYHVQSNAGLSAARNEALRRSTGEFIAFLDHDDLWEPKKLERQIPLFDRNPRVGLVYADCVNFTEHGYRYRQFERFRPFRGPAFGPLLRHYFLNLQTVVVRRAAIDGLTEWFDPRLKLCEEADLFLRIARTWELDYVDEPLARWRLHHASTSRAQRTGFPAEMELLLDKQATIDPAFGDRYAAEVGAFRLDILRLRARIAWEEGRRADAIELLGPARLASWAMFKDWLLIHLLSHQTYDRMLTRLRRTDTCGKPMKVRLARWPKNRRGPSDMR